MITCWKDKAASMRKSDKEKGIWFQLRPNIDFLELALRSLNEINGKNYDY